MDALQKLTYDEYDKAAGVRKGYLDLIRRSPAHYLQETLCPSPETPALLWGRMFHSLVLEPDEFYRQYAVWDNSIDRRTREGKEAWADWEIDNGGKIAVAKPDMATLKAMRDAVYSEPKLCELLEEGLVERSVFWDVETAHGVVRCKARPDLYSVRRRVVLDLKSCIDARRDAFKRSIANYRYHVQAGMYTDGIKQATGEPVKAFLFAAVEKEKPNGIGLYVADAGMIEQGKREYRCDLEVYAECEATDIWPCYPTDWDYIELPTYAQEDTYGG